MPSAPRTRHDQLQASLAWLDALAAKPWPRQPHCEGCQHYVPDPINPPAGMGQCQAGHGWWHAAAPHPCGHHQPKEHGTPA